MKPFAQGHRTVRVDLQLEPGLLTVAPVFSPLHQNKVCSGSQKDSNLAPVTARKLPSLTRLQRLVSKAGMRRAPLLQDCYKD